jgi:hypothetical protein
MKMTILLISFLTFTNVFAKAANDGFIEYKTSLRALNAKGIRLEALPKNPTPAQAQLCTNGCTATWSTYIGPLGGTKYRIHCTCPKPECSYSYNLD